MKKPATPTAPPASVNAYLADLPADVHAALQALRRAIKAAAPNATEAINYRVPTFMVDGKPLVSFGAATAHCTLFLRGTAVLRAHAAALKGHPTGNGSVRFVPEKPLPPALVRTLVRARLAELRAGA